MKKVIIVLMMTMLVGFVSNEVSAQKKKNEVVYFKSSMDCGNCQKSITEYIKFEKGVKDLKVDHVSNTIKIEYRKGKNSDEKLAAAIKKKGYKAEKITAEQYKEIISKLTKKEH